MRAINTGAPANFRLAKITERNNIVLITSLTYKETDFITFFDIIINELKELLISSIEGEACFSKFCLHRVSIDGCGKHVAADLHKNKPELQLAQTLR